MVRRQSWPKKNSRADIEAKLRNLIDKGLVVARTDSDGKLRYFQIDEASSWADDPTPSDC
jgi:hypothetical protein